MRKVSSNLAVSSDHLEIPGASLKKNIVHQDLAQRCTGSLPAVADAIYAIGGKWKLRIIVGLAEGHKRFNALQRALQGISAKVLTNELRDLELNGFVTRKVHTGIPVVVEYELTEYSETLRDVMRSLSEWGLMHRETIRQNLISTKIVAQRADKDEL